jgi:hypothetical protein
VAPAPRLRLRRRAHTPRAPHSFRARSRRGCTNSGEDRRGPTHTRAATGLIPIKPEAAGEDVAEVLRLRAASLRQTPHERASADESDGKHDRGPNEGDDSKPRPEDSETDRRHQDRRPDAQRR